MDTGKHSTPVSTTPVPAVTELQPYRVEAAVRLLREQDLGRAAIPIGEYVRLFQAPELGKGAFIQYFWHTLEEMDQCLTPLCAFFGEKLPRAISSDELAEYVAQRGSIGVTTKAILQELSCLDAVVRSLRCKHSFSLPSRKFLKPAPPAGKEPSEAAPSAPVGVQERREAPVRPVDWCSPVARAETRAQILALGQARVARQDIAERVGRSYKFVCRVLRAAGLKAGSALCEHCHAELPESTQQRRFCNAKCLAAAYRAARRDKKRNGNGQGRRQKGGSHG
jgi:hypothetical protein